MVRYAQIDDSGVCVSVSELSSEVNFANMIPLSLEEHPSGKKWTGGGWENLPTPAPTGDEVNAERDRRIAVGHTFTVAGYGDVPIQGRLQDQINLQARLISAQAYKAAGITDAVLVLRDAENVNRVLTPDQMIELVTAGAAWIEATMKVSWDMKDGVNPFHQGIPLNYAADIYWP